MIFYTAHRVKALPDRIRELFGAKSAEFVDPRVDVEEALSEITRDRCAGAATLAVILTGTFWGRFW